jgi:hypothetical protein
VSWRLRSTLSGDLPEGTEETMAASEDYEEA